MPLRSDDLEPVTLRRYFPAEVTMPDATFLRNALVIVTRVRVYVFDKPELPLYDDVIDLEGSTLAHESVMRHTAATIAIRNTSGGPFALAPMLVNKARGCGCGNPLKTYQPWAPVRAANR